MPDIKKTLCINCSFYWYWWHCCLPLYTFSFHVNSNLYYFWIATTTSDPNVNQRSTQIPSKSTDNTVEIVGASAATGIVLTLLIIGIVYLIRTKKICRYKFDKTDPYIDVIPDTRESSGDFTFFGNEGTELSSSSWDLTKPRRYAKHSNEYINTTFYNKN